MILTLKTIDSFQGEFRWLSNFWPCTIRFKHKTYPSVEHAYQAAKTIKDDEREKIRMASTAAQAKQLGKVVTKRPDWKDIKVDVMQILLERKFKNETLRELLINTGDAELVEGNWWGDRFWGVCGGTGENTLGKLLMQIRSDIKKSPR